MILSTLHIDTIMNAETPVTSVLAAVSCGSQSQFGGWLHSNLFREASE